MTIPTKSSPSPIEVCFMSDWSKIRHKQLKDCWIVVTTTQNPQERWLATYANLICQRGLFHDIGTASIEIVIDGLDRGLPTSAVDRVTDLMGINRGTLSRLLDVSQRTLSRRDTLRASVSERLFRVSALFQKALEVMGDREEAQRWFCTPKKALGGKTPLQFSETDVGAREVEDLLGRIDYGVYA